MESNCPSCSETVRLLSVDVLTSDLVWKINVAGKVLQNGPLRLYQAGILYPPSIQCSQGSCDACDVLAVLLPCAHLFIIHPLGAGCGGVDL